MQKQQYIAIGIGTLVLLLLYFGMDTVPPKQKELEKSRALSIEMTGNQNVIDLAFKNLSKEKQSIIDALQLDVDNASTDSLKIERLKILASSWYEMGSPAVSAIYAEQIAEKENTEPSWSIAGTTFMLCARDESDQKTRDFCSKRALKSFEMAISLAPDKVEPKINQALVFVDNPEKDNPMKGILMLRELQQKYPQNTSVLNQLATLAIKTNQIDKALERLEESYKIDPSNMNTICLLAEVYTLAGNEQKAAMFRDMCKS